MISDAHIAGNGDWVGVQWWLAENTIHL